MFPQRLLHRSKENLRWTYSVDFIERFPLFVRHSKDLRGLDCPLHLARPHFKIFDVLLLEEIPQTFGKLDRESTTEGCIRSTRWFEIYVLPYFLYMHKHWPLFLCQTSPSLLRCVPWCWGRSHRGDRGRWSAVWCGCSSSSRQFGFGRGQRHGSPGNDGPRPLSLCRTDPWNETFC